MSRNKITISSVTEDLHDARLPDALGTAGQVPKISGTGFAYGDIASTATVTIAVADWNSGTTCTKSVTGVTASNIVIVDPSDADVSCTAQGDGTLTFTCTSTPTDAVTVKVVII